MAIKNKTQLKTDLDLTIYENVARGIIPTTHNAIVTDLLDSSMNTSGATDAYGVVSIEDDVIFQGLRNFLQGDNIALPGTGLVQIAANYNSVGFTGAGIINGLSIIKDNSRWSSTDDLRIITATTLEGTITGGTPFYLFVNAGTVIKHNWTISPVDNLPTTANEYRPIYTESKTDETFASDTVIVLLYNKKTMAWHLSRSASIAQDIVYEIPITFDIDALQTAGIKLNFPSGNHSMIWGDGIASAPISFVNGVELTNTFANGTFYGKIISDSPEVITQLHADTSRISEISGLDQLTALINLDLSYNKLTGDFVYTNKTALTNIHLRNNLFTSIDVSGCSNVITTAYQFNMSTIVSLNLAGCSSLTVLWVLSSPNLTNLDITGCSGLTDIQAQNSNLNSINILDCVNLVKCWAYNTNITTVNLLNGTNLTNLQLNNTPLANIQNLASLTSIVTLSLEYTSLSGAFSFTNSTTLTTLKLRACNFSSIDVSGSVNLNTTSYQFDNNSSLVTLNVTNCNSLSYLWLLSSPLLASLILTGCSGLTDIQPQNSSLESIDITDCVNLVNLRLEGCAIDTVTGLDLMTKLTAIKLQDNAASDIQVDAFVNDMWTAMQVVPNFTGGLNVGGTNATRTVASDVAATGMTTGLYSWVLTE